MNPTKEQLADPKWWDENAPEGATHYACEDHACRALWVKDGYYSCADEAFVKWCKDNAPDMHGELISRPSAWTGKGLPPVGTVCESCVPGTDGWFKCSVLIHHPFEDGVAGVHDVVGHALLWTDTFRPIRTPEQIEAEERERAIIEISKILGCLWASEQEAAAYLYDAGYRKQEQTK